MKKGSFYAWKWGQFRYELLLVFWHILSLWWSDQKSMIYTIPVSYTRMQHCWHTDRLEWIKATSFTLLWHSWISVSSQGWEVSFSAITLLVYLMSWIVGWKYLRNKHQYRTWHNVNGDAYGTSIKVPSAVSAPSLHYSSYPHDGIGQTYVSSAATLQQLAEG